MCVCVWATTGSRRRERMANVQQPETESVTVLLHNRPVTLHEGDLVFTRSNLVSSVLIALANRGMSHVTTVCKVDGKLQAVGVTSAPWTDAKGQVWPAGITIEPLALFNDPIYTHAWRVTPRTPRTQAQTALLRLGVEAVRQGDQHDGNKYEGGPAEFVHTAMHWQPATRKRWHCSELAAHLAATCGGFRGSTESCTLPGCAKGVGDYYDRLF